jgi:hypothetical protein
MGSGFLRGALVATAVLAASSAFAGTNLIVNGDFTSTPTFQYGSWGEWPSITGWTAVSDAIEVGTNGTYGLPTVGGGVNLEVNANTFGDDYQVVSGLKVGATYTLSYLSGGRTGGGTQALDVYFGGQKLTTDTGSYSSWTPNTFVITATATTETLEFVSQATGGLPSYGNEITGVSLAAPEASTWAMMGLGFAGLAFAGFRARRTATAIA